VPSDAEDGSTIDNTAIATDQSGDSSSDSNFVLVGCGVKIEKTADKAIANVGETVRYHIEVTNVDTLLRQFVLVSDLDGMAPAVWDIIASGTGVVEPLPWSGNSMMIPELKPGETVIFEFDYIIPAAYQPGDVIFNTAQASFPEGGETVTTRDTWEVEIPWLGSSVSGVVTYDGYNPGQIKPAQIYLYDSNDDLVDSTETLRGETFVFENVQDGVYKIVAHKKNHTKSTVRNVAVNGGDVVIAPTLTLYAGDMDVSGGGGMGDGYISVTDYGILLNDMYAAGVNHPSDLTDDDYVSITDHGLMLANMYRTAQIITLP
jgi:hypothetical protein